MDSMNLKSIIEMALAEDVGHGDITTFNLVEAGQQGCGMMTRQSAGILAGLPVAQLVFASLDPESQFTALKTDGDHIEPGDKLAHGAGQPAVPAGRRTPGSEFSAKTLRNCQPDQPDGGIGR